MALKASVYVTEKGANSYTAQIVLSQNRQYGMRPLQLSCTLTKGRHDLAASFGDKQLEPDEDTRELFEHLILYGAQKIVKTQVDILKAQCGGRVCNDTDDESGLYVESQVPGHVETEIRDVPDYLQRLTDALKN